MLLAMMLGVALTQEAPARVETDADGTQRWSILADPCASEPRDPDEVLVCRQRIDASPRLPLPGARGAPDRPMPGNPDRSGIGALEMTSAPCATRSEGCTTGVDLIGGSTMLVRGIGKLIDPDSCCDTPGEGSDPIALVNDIGGVFKRTFAKKPDTSNRVPIPLDDPAPAGPLP
jgi:hypothetical protein